MERAEGQGAPETCKVFDMAAPDTATARNTASETTTVSTQTISGASIPTLLEPLLAEQLPSLACCATTLPTSWQLRTRVIGSQHEWRQAQEEQETNYQAAFKTTTTCS